MASWHEKKIDEVMSSLQSGVKGLSSEEVAQRLTQYGYNELKEKKKRTALRMFLEEFKDIFIILLLIATVFSVTIGYYESIPKSVFSGAASLGTLTTLVDPALPSGFVGNYVCFIDGSNLGEFRKITISNLGNITFEPALSFPIAVGVRYEIRLNPPLGFVEVYADAMVIGIIVLLVVVAGFVQEYRAEKALEALKKLTAPKARVLRNGKEETILAKEIVPGDVLLIESGDSIAADARLIEAVELKTDEAVLTGESTPVNKSLDVIQSDTPIAERSNMVFTATHAIYGRGKAIVTSTGMSTEFGKIAELVQTAEDEETPLERKLDKFAKKIAMVVTAVCVIIFALEAFEALSIGFKVESFIEAFMSSISLAISAVPEGLPAIVTISLALGAREFAKRNAIIRKLSSAESLGATTIICSDKTGTLTKGEMTIRKLYSSGKMTDVTGAGYEPKGEFHQSTSSINPKEDNDLSLLLQIGTLCNNARLDLINNAWNIIGDPTEGALIVAAAKAGYAQKELEHEYPRRNEIPFTSERKRMTTIHSTPEGEYVAYVKGAPEILLERCAYILKNGEVKRLTSKDKNEVLKINEKLASDALRMLAMAYRKLPNNVNASDEQNIEKDLIFVGLQGMIDPPREEAIKANQICQQAGIKAAMITGDHKLTAMAVAKEIGILKENSIVLTGTELDKISDDAFKEMVEDVAVYARVSPEHKLRIVNALKAKGHIVAMTGDGVNDAPAVKSADVGVSMGISGTDVTREASDLVLTDDNFATIVKAVEEGRVIYDNIRKYARFLLACNFDEVLVIGLFAILGGLFGTAMFPLPLLPSMILWINLVTDGAPAVSLATDPPDEDVMERKPRKPDEGILHGMGAFIIASFVLQSLGTILVFSLEYYLFPAHPWGWPNGPIDEAARQLTLAEARTAAFVQAAFFELFVVWNCRSEKRSVWRMGRDALKNKFFVIAEIISIAATFSICYIPPIASVFGLVPLTPTDLLYVLFAASWGLFVLPELLMNRKVWKWK